jgi:hypothetical protein
MVAFSTLKAGDVLYQVVSQRAGNTTMRRQAVFDVVIEEVRENCAIVRWNGNAPRPMYRRELEKLRRSKPAPKPSIFDMARAIRAKRDSDGNPSGGDGVAGSVAKP